MYFLSNWLHRTRLLQFKFTVARSSKATEHFLAKHFHYTRPKFSSLMQIKVFSRLPRHCKKFRDRWKCFYSQSEFESTCWKFSLRYFLIEIYQSLLNDGKHSCACYGHRSVYKGAVGCQKLSVKMVQFTWISQGGSTRVTLASFPCGYKLMRVGSFCIELIFECLQRRFTHICV